MKVLVTGASGLVARGVIQTLAKYHTLKLLDLTRSERFADHDWAVGSILDPAFLENALQDVDTIVHCVKPPEADDHHTETAQGFDINLKGLYFLLDIAVQAGIRRFVHVSSTAPVIGNWYEGQDITIDAAYTTRGRYSLTKMLQERICEHMARNSDMTLVALRLWVPCEGVTMVDESGQEVPRPYHPGLIDTRDFGEACHLALETEDIGPFEIFHIVATQEAQERFDAARTKSILGFEAKEDFHHLLFGRREV